MKKSLNTRYDIKLTDTYNNIVFHLEDDLIQDWILSLILLQKQLIDSLILHHNQHNSIIVKVDSNLEKFQRARIESSNESIFLYLSALELEVWLFFFLRYYRDGIGDVDHIDTDIPINNTSQKPWYITLTIPRARPPMSEAELRQLLDTIE